MITEISLMIAILAGIVVYVGLHFIGIRSCEKMRCGDKRYIKYNGIIYLATYSCSTRRGWYWFEFTVENEYIDVEIHYTDIL